METTTGGQAQHFYVSDAPDFVLREKDFLGGGKRSMEWDLNNWKWDGDLFIASPLNSAPTGCRSSQLFPVGEIPAAVGSSNSSSSCSDEINLGTEKGKREPEKRRRVVVVENHDSNDGVGNLTLKLGGHVYPITESELVNLDEKNGKKTKFLGATLHRAACQVEDCEVNLSNAKDYHRRHKVCEMHSKASQALVRNVMQRFCQQCSRFHVLQEFDEGKRSCRRRLAGHNKRRRKTHHNSVVNGSSLNDDQASNYLLISLLRILSNMPSINPSQINNQDILSHLLKNLASLASTIDGRNMPGLLQESQDFLNVETSAGTSSEMVPAFLSSGPESSRLLCSTSKINSNIDAQLPQMRTIDRIVNVAESSVLRKGSVIDYAPDGTQQTLPIPKSTTLLPVKDNPTAKVLAPDSAVRRVRLTNIDLNNIYNDSLDYTEGLEGSHSPINLGAGSLDCSPWLQKNSHQLSPPQTSGSSESASALSPSSSGGDAQSRTDRIVFKLFGKDPNDFPLVLRAQILDWLSHSPTDIESYIRPGCIILTLYLRLAESTWKELSRNLSSSLSRLLDVSNDTFWTTGWVFTRVQHHIAFIYNGQVVLEKPLSFGSHNHCQILSVTPVAVSVSQRVQFIVKGFNLSQPTTRLLCALEGKYLFQETAHDLVDTKTVREHDELQCLSFPCYVPDEIGRGFIEVEDHGLSGGFFPFIVAEEDVCSEIRMLESAVEVVESGGEIQGATGKMEAKNQALDFIHEMGWLLHRSRLRSRLGHIDSKSDVFTFTRFRWLMEFSMDQDWCAIVKKLLDILFDGIVVAGEHSSIELALSEMGLLHRAVSRSCRQMVELLLRYFPDKASATAESPPKQQMKRGSDSFLFRPDATGPAGLTPLHVAASRDGSESVLDALTDDPGLVGVEAWKNARDSTGSTPEDYAHLRGHHSYIHLVRRKINKKTETGHVVLDIPGVPLDCNSNQKQTERLNSTKVSSFQINKTELGPNQIGRNCKLCDQQLAYSTTSRVFSYRPVMLSMVAIAAVCVCVSLFFKSSPEVMYVFPFTWEVLEYGYI